MGATLAGDENLANMYVQHNTDAGEPDFAFIGRGLTPNLDDGTWAWTGMIRRAGLVSGNYEFTGRLSRASANTYYVAAKFIKGAHVYYPPAGSGWNAWGDWSTALWTTNTWIVLALPPPSNVYARYVTTNRVDVYFSPDGAHWVSIFRKAGAEPEFTPPADGTAYYVGASNAGQGECVYRGDVSAFVNTGRTPDTVFSYRLYTENYTYYSTGIAASASTDPDRDDDGDQMPNEFEVGAGLNPGLRADGLGDLDQDRFLNWEEYIAGTDLNNSTSLLHFTDIFSPTKTDGRVRWSSVEGKAYALWFATNLNQAWTALGSNLVATAPENTVTNAIDGVANGYYRIQVQR